MKRPEHRHRPDPGRTNVVGGLQRERKPSTMGSDQVAERLSSLTVGDSPGTPGVSTLLHQQRREPVLPEQALRLTRPTDGFLCPLSANKYKIDFREFEIKDYDSGESLFHVKRDPEAALPTVPDDIDPAMEAAVRTVRYTFPTSFLGRKTIRTALVFSVGPDPVPNFRMIERHYFKDELVRSHDFNFGFCIPMSVNSWEAIYDMPELTKEREEEILASPFEMRSDSFYYVGDTLVMHNKAEYQYKD